MSKQMFEFYCNDCSGWILLTINQEHKGKFGIKCPNCGRLHPRELKSGDLRMPYGEILTVGKRGVSITRGIGEGDFEEILEPMKSAYSKNSRLDKIDKNRRESGQLVGTTDLWLNGVFGEQCDFEVRKE